MFLLIISSLIAIMIIELILRLVEYKFDTIKKLTYSPYKKTGIDKIVDWQSLQYTTGCALLPNQKISDFSTNSHGFLSEEISYYNPLGAKRIVFLGDSFLTTTPFRYHFIPLIHAEIKAAFAPMPVQSINLGIACTGTSVYRKVFEVEGVHYKPDIVVVNLFVGNDFTDDMSNIKNINETYRSNENQLTKKLYNIRIFALLKNMSVILAAYMPSRPYPVPLDGIRAFGDWTKSNSNEEDDPFAPSFSKEQHLKIEKRRSEILLPNSYIYENMPLIKNNLLHIKNLALSIGADVLIVIIPDELQVNKTLRDEVNNLTPENVYNIRYPQKQLIQFFTENQIDYIDLLEYFERDPYPETYYKPRDTHFNAIGNKRVSEILSPKLQKILEKSITSP